MKNKFKKWLFKLFYNQIVDTCSDDIRKITQYQVVSREAEIRKYETQLKVPYNVNDKTKYEWLSMKKRELLHKLYDDIDVEMIEDDGCRCTRVRLVIYVAIKNFNL